MTTVFSSIGIRWKKYSKAMARISVPSLYGHGRNSGGHWAETHRQAM